MFLKLFQAQAQALCGFARQMHTQMCLATLFDQRRKVENQWRKGQGEATQMEWNDDEDEQRRAFHEEDGKKIVTNKQIKCEITGKLRRQIDCECKDMCLAKKSETYLIHYEGGVGFIH